MSDTAPLIQGTDFVRRPNDAETLAVLVSVFKPAIVTALGHAIATQFVALRERLDQHGRRLAAIPDCAEKSALIQDVMLARALCERIRSELDNCPEGLLNKPDIAADTALKPVAR